MTPNKKKWDFWDYYEAQTPIQKDLRDGFISSNPSVNVFGTLTFDSEHGVSFNHAKKVFGKFIRLVKAHYYGVKSKKRIRILPVIEKSLVEHGGSRYARQDGTHIHFIADIPGHPADSLPIIKSLWKASSRIAGNPDVYCPKSNDWYQILKNHEGQLAATQYTIKSCRINTQTVLWEFVQPFKT